MNLVAMMAALVAALTCVVSSQAFVMPGTPMGGAAARAGQALGQPSASPAVATGSRASGASAVGALNVKIVVGEDENVESALMRFRRNVSRSGHLQELRWKRQFETVAERKKRKIEQNRKKERIQRARDRKQKMHAF